MSASQPQDRISLTREIIPNAVIAREIRGDEDGAVATFDGCVRNHSHGRSTLYLEYEAYESMALGKMQEIAAHLHGNFAVNRVAIVHRLGRLEIGETSVFIAVSASHLPAAVDACRYPIDTLKKTMTILKKKIL